MNVKKVLSKLVATGLTAAALATNAGESAPLKFTPLPLGNRNGPAPDHQVLNHYGVPFLDGTLPLTEGKSASVEVGARVERIFLLGMNDSNKINTGGDQKGRRNRGPSEIIRPAIPANGWADPRDSSVHFFIGDDLGQIRLDYADGTTQVFPLILGESVWWGRMFYDYPEPFSIDAHLRQAFADSLRLYPPAPVEDGRYVAVIQPRAVPLTRITFENSPAKKGSLVIDGITVETTGSNSIAGTVSFPTTAFTPDFARFIKHKALRPAGENEQPAQRQLENLRLALYSSEATFKGPLTSQMPPGYSGPRVFFQGNLAAEVLAKALAYNVQDIADKITPDGMYHTSTSNALSWGGYKSFGTYRKNLGRYYDAAFARDMGRSLQEIAALGYTNEALRCADYSLKMARLWQTDPKLEDDGVSLPPHWGQLINRPSNGTRFENDGHGLTSLFLYRLWQQLPDRDDWLRSHWSDVQAAGDWVLWQFEHPEISGATNGILHTTGESANGNGYSVYPDSVCMNALLALAQMADSIGETNSAMRWRDRAGKMRTAITEQYIINDPKYGRVWTLAYADWPNKSTVLGPLIFQADHQGFAPEDSDPAWRPVNEATYQRLIDTYPPLGFYGQAMGYGQGFVTESALLLDRMADATKMLDWTAREIYDPRFGSFIVPEGVQISPDGRFWYRMGDLGNGVQEGEIVKTLRLVIGVDDTQPRRLQFFPRMPYDWKEIVVDGYPVVFERSGKLATTHLHYQLKRAGAKMKLEISANEALGPVAMRLGPFAREPKADAVQVNGQDPANPANPAIEHSGDSWWVRFTFAVGSR